MTEQLDMLPAPASAPAPASPLQELMLMPLGKYKGREISEIATTDPEYLKWLTAQSWFEQRYGHLFQTIITNNYYNEPAETPDHNAMQVRFLDVRYKRNFAELFGARWLFHEARRGRLWDYTEEVRDARIAVARLVEAVAEAQFKADSVPEKDEFGYSHPHNQLRWAGEELQKGEEKLEAKAASLTQDLPKIRAAQWHTFKSEFEVHGWDVAYEVRVSFPKSRTDMFHFLIECKPTMGDDYPAVLRQMENQWDRYSDRGMQARRDYDLICVVGEYTGRGATWEQVQQIFDSKGFKLILESDIDAA